MLEPIREVLLMLFGYKYLFSRQLNTICKLILQNTFIPLYLQSQSGRLAQLVQSTCLTSRGSLVRTQYLPRKADESRLFLLNPIVCFAAIYYILKYWINTILVVPATSMAEYSGIFQTTRDLPAVHRIGN